jgi:hypothetical protein
MTLQQAGLAIIVLVWVVTFFDGVVGENATSRWAFWLITGVWLYQWVF